MNNDRNSRTNDFRMQYRRNPPASAPAEENPSSAPPPPRTANNNNSSNSSSSAAPAPARNSYRYFDEYVRMRRELEADRYRFGDEQIHRLRLNIEERDFRARRNLTDEAIILLRRQYFLHRVCERLAPPTQPEAGAGPSQPATAPQMGNVTIEVRRNNYLNFDTPAARGETQEVNAPQDNDRSSEDSNGEELLSGLSRDNNYPNLVSVEQRHNNLIRRSESLDQRIDNLWEEINERLEGVNTQDMERRINLCYRNLVDQYETLVRRYFDISRNRDTVSTCSSCRT